MNKRKQGPNYVNNSQGQTLLFDAVFLNETRVMRAAVEKSVSYCYGAKERNELPPTMWNLPKYEILKFHQKQNLGILIANLPLY